MGAFRNIAYGLQDQSEYGVQRTRSGKRGYANPDKLRQDAMNSSEGGRGWCEICNHGFSMNYIRHTVRNMKNIDVCVDCARKHGLRSV